MSEMKYGYQAECDTNDLPDAPTNFSGEPTQDCLLSVYHLKKILWYIPWHDDELRVVVLRKLKEIQGI